MDAKPLGRLARGEQLRLRGRAKQVGQTGQRRGIAGKPIDDESRE